MELVLAQNILFMLFLYIFKNDSWYLGFFIVLFMIIMSSFIVLGSSGISVIIYQKMISKLKNII